MIPSSDHSYVLVVEAGPQEATTLDLASGTYSLGSEPENDIVLYGNGVPERGCSIHIGERLGTVDRVSSASQLRSLYPGEQLVFGTVTIGLRLRETAIRVVPDDKPMHVAPWIRTSGSAVAGLAMLFCLAPVTQPGNYEVAHGASMLTTTVAPEATRNVDTDFDRRGTLALLNEHLRARGLSTINAQLTPSGEIEVRGRLTAEDKPEWLASLRWLDESASGKAVVVDHTQLSEAVAPLTVSGVLLGPDGFVIDREGRHIAEGQTIQGGWIVKQILADRVLLDRDGQDLIVRF